MIKPEHSFYLFGMGNRKKFLYKQGQLIDAVNGELMYSWEIIKDEIVAEAYCVQLHCCDHQVVRILENEEGVWVVQGDSRDCLTTGAICLPDFLEYSCASLLRILHHELLINVIDGMPVPNFFVYHKPWYRDAAMMAMCFRKTNNLHLISDWILTLDEPYDGNNSGIHEPDNLGQALYLISLVSDRHHPLVEDLLSEADKCRKDGYIIGQSDYMEHPVYQTKWLKFGLSHLGLPDSFIIPQIYDTYSALFWMDYLNQHVPGAGFDKRTSELYPYLWWAEAHFHNWPVPHEFFQLTYPLTWEWQASEANYSGIARVAKSYADHRFSAPHTWHAAEMFLYLTDDRSEAYAWKL